MTNKKIVSFFVLMLTIVGISSVCFASEKGKITGTTVRVRYDASTSSTVLLNLYKNDEVTILDKTDDWYKINYEDQIGWVSKQYVSIDTSNIVEKSTTGQVELLLIPIINSKSIATIEKGEKVNVCDTLNGWVNIQYNNLKGWVREEKLEEYKETVILKYVYVDVNSAKVREKPSTSSTELDRLNKDTKVAVIGEEGKWYKIQFMNVTGYISKELTRTTKAVVVSRSNDERQSSTTVTSSNSNNNASTKNNNTTTSNNVETSSNSNTSEEVATTSAKTNTEDLSTNSNTTTATTSDNEKTTENQQTTTVGQSITQTSSKGDSVVAYAKKYLGYPYVSGGAGPKSFDCSGFTQYVMKNFGISLTHSARAQASNGTYVSKANLQKGDLVFFSQDGSGKNIGHVGIYIGGNQFIHACTPAKGVRLDSLSSTYYSKNYVTARRVL